VHAPKCSCGEVVAANHITPPGRMITDQYGMHYVLNT